MTKPQLRKGLNADERFWKRVRRGGLNECWLWLGRVGSDGYGVVDVQRYPVRRSTTAHRVVYQRLVGPIPPGLDLDHLCRNRQCVNPRHLEPVTRAENMLRGRLSLAPDGCANGHPRDAQTTRMYRGNPVCRACENARGIAYRQRLRA